MSYFRDGLVYDFDSTLPFPTPFKEYMSKSLIPYLDLSPEFKRTFRVVESSLFHFNFSSDRSHMIRNGEYLSEPPTYPCIIKGNLFFAFDLLKGPSNLNNYLNVSQNDINYGTLYSQKEFLKLF